MGPMTRPSGGIEHARSRVVAVLTMLGVVAGIGIAGDLAVSTPATAAVAGDFDPGYIISDSQFYDPDGMTADEIKAFLNARIGACQNGKCLNVVKVPLESRPPRYAADAPYSLVCDAITGGDLWVWEVIYRVQVACGISAKVILVTLQKEQGLVTKTAPSDYALMYAMGYGCPDTGGCTSAVAGLGYQLYQGARQLKTYKLWTGWRFQPGPEYISYHPSGSCGGTTVDIRNFATAALYNYTPYQPNAAALGNMYGTGDSCSSYGNRNFWRYYSDWFGKPTEITPRGVTVERIGGSDRYVVAAGISAATFAPSVPVVYVASGEGFADAISAGPAAAHQNGPVLLVARDWIPPSIAAELRRLQPARVVVVGGPASVSDAVLTQLASYTPAVVRVGGADRYEVSRNLALEVFGAGAATAYLATGAVFADALSSGAAAGSQNAPVILVDGSQAALDEATGAVLQTLGVTQARVAGGPASVSDGVLNSLKTKLGASAVTRFGGSTRFAVSAAVNKAAFAQADTFFVAAGLTFPDALSATPAAVAAGAPLYITPSTCMDRALAQHLIDAGASRMVIVGGPASVSGAVAAFTNC